MGSAARSNLMEVGQNGDLLPELAEGFDVSDDARTWKFNLRRGVEFHNGKTVDANDVVAARTSALTTGETDAMDRVDLKTAHLLKRRKGIKIVETSGTQHYAFTMRTDTPPFSTRSTRPRPASTSTWSVSLTMAIGPTSG